MVRESERIASAFADIPEVECVFLVEEGDFTHVFPVLNYDSYEVWDRIFDRQIELAKRFPSRHLDFNILARRGGPLHEVAGRLTPAWQREACLAQSGI